MACPEDRRDHQAPAKAVPWGPSVQVERAARVEAAVEVRNAPVVNDRAVNDRAAWESRAVNALEPSVPGANDRVRRLVVQVAAPSADRTAGSAYAPAQELAARRAASVFVRGSALVAPVVRRVASACGPVWVQVVPVVRRAVSAFGRELAQGESADRPAASAFTQELVPGERAWRAQTPLTPMALGIDRRRSWPNRRHWFERQPIQHTARRSLRAKRRLGRQPI